MLEVLQDILSISRQAVSTSRSLYASFVPKLWSETIEEHRVQVRDAILETTADLVAKCHAAQIPAQPVRDMADILDDPHLRATGFFERRDHPSEGGYFAMASPLKFGKRAAGPAGDAPRLGEHNSAVRKAAPDRS